MNLPEGRLCGLSLGVTVFVLGTDLGTADRAGSRDLPPQAHLLGSGTQIFCFPVDQYKLVKAMNAESRGRVGKGSKLP